MRNLILKESNAEKVMGTIIVIVFILIKYTRQTTERPCLNAFFTLALKTSPVGRRNELGHDLRIQSEFLAYLQGDDLFKNDPFKSDLPASGETNGTASGISNGRTL